MKKAGYLLIYIFIGMIQPLFAQDDELLIDPILVDLKGQVKNIDDGLPVAYASVVNPRTHGGAITDDNGFFSMEVLNVDSLVVSLMGFTKKYYHIPYDQNEDSLFIIWAKPIRYIIQQIDVTGNSPEVNMDGIPTGKPINISPELRGDAFNSNPPWYAAVLSPASFLQYYLSGKEKEKRAVRAAIISQEEWELLSLYYNKDMVMALTSLNTFEADTFMVYFNSKYLLSARSTEYDIRAAIITEFKNYQKEKQQSAE